MDERERAVQIELAVNGDVDALQRLIVDYHAPLRAAVENELGVLMRAHIDPDDVLQDAYVSANRSIKARKFEGPAPFYKWLETIAVNALKNRWRALRTKKRDVVREDRGAMADTGTYADRIRDLAAPIRTPSREVARGEGVAAVMSSLARLTEDQRQVVCLRFLEGMPVAGVAARLGKTESAVHSLCRRGLAALRESMASISRYLTRK